MREPAKYLKTHVASWMHGLKPPLKLLMQHVMKGDDDSDHWLWSVDSDAKFPRRLSEYGHAYISWASRPEVKRGIFCVARMLIEHHKGPFPEHASFTNRCGRPACVNPDHWRWVEPIPRYRFDSSEFGWRVVERRTNRPVSKRLFLVVRDRNGVTHGVGAAPVPTSRFVAMCEALIVPDECAVLATGSLITCKGGC